MALSDGLVAGFHQLRVSADPDQTWTKNLFLKQYEPTTKRNSNSADVEQDDERSWASRTVFVTHMDGLEEKHLTDIFSCFGEVEKVSLKRIERREVGYLRREGIKQEVIQRSHEFVIQDFSKIFSSCI